ncbi:phenylalanine--tRNA ligase subunit beta [Sphingomonas astaxanthinifaciens]|uniref:Phenylalanine--tRNA ligase beta subunit n=1 Tax=Sphingomonas astaxanthinifaciens DSM 22298 TaxID=1123267 RepID=A0ABQ5Z8B0_9SPHN|nr:phenylalanine--tRNA ligase subunit beta [Sphingomonas astaxanthinifaciens]GLR46807.1 phenylalanine--tRNA ligase beta subunit [Sphingomonas astaxanthinifaciens DSM 22298]
MKFTLSWLKDHLDTDASVQEIADKLTSVGLEVEGVENPAEKLAPFVVAEVLSAERHPQADKLQVLQVDAGNGPLQVVCGAPNARAGMKGVFGPPGAYVPGSDFTLKVAAIRGVESNGMMCSERELELGQGHDGIIELPADAPVGQSFAAYAGLEDPVFDIAVTPNRPDCFGVRGIARDLAAAGLGTLRDWSVLPFEGKFANPVAIRVEEGSGCEAFAGRLIRGVRNGPSPEWLQRRLVAVGLRPISALVDITNFFSLAAARPLHVYDAAKLQGGITARRGRAGEQFLALNDKDYAVSAEDCVIADEGHVLGLGGVIGGDSTGVSEGTTDVLLECAWFDPVGIARTGQRHQVNTDARARFERGVDPETLLEMTDAATAMILKLCGGEASEVTLATTARWAEVVAPRAVPLRPERVASLAGLDLPASEQEAILTALGFEQADGGWRVPGWRPDIDGEADLVEEIARLAGLDRIPSTPLPRLPGVAKAIALPGQRLERRVRRAAAARGLHEAVTWSFISEADAAAFGGAPHRLANPISEDMKVMRGSLLPGLARAAGRNLARGATSVRLFELGRRYLQDGERPTLGIILAGEASGRDWQSGKARGFTPFDVKAAVVALLGEAGAPVSNLQLAAGAGESFHPGRSATLRLGKAELARFGELHPTLAKDYDLPVGTQVAELALDAIPAARDKGRARAAFTPPLLQPVTRDFAFLVPEGLAAGDLVRAVRGADKALISDVRLFDRYQPQEGELSLALEVTLQPTERTLTEADLNALSDKVVAAANKLGARLRA